MTSSNLVPRRDPQANSNFNLLLPEMYSESPAEAVALYSSSTKVAPAGSFKKQVIVYCFAQEVLRQGRGRAKDKKWDACLETRGLPGYFHDDLLSTVISFKSRLPEL